MSEPSSSPVTVMSLLARDLPLKDFIRRLQEQALQGLGAALSQGKDPKEYLPWFDQLTEALLTEIPSSVLRTRFEMAEKKLEELAQEVQKLKSTVSFQKLEGMKKA